MNEGSHPTWLLRGSRVDARCNCGGMVTAAAPVCMPACERIGSGPPGKWEPIPAGTFPGRDEALADNTHHCAYGAYELARCVVEGIKAKVPELAKHLAKDVPPFDPANPAAPEKVNMPASPVTGPVEKPEGS